MALRFAEGFDHQALTDVAAKWTTNSGNPSAMVAGRFGTGQAARWDTANRVWKKVLDSQSTWIVGMAWKVDQFVANLQLISFFDGAIAHCDLRCDATGHLFFTRNATVIGAVGTTVLSINTWYYIEAKVTIGDVGATPTSENSCRINGVAELTQTNLDNRNAGNATADTIGIEIGPGSGVSQYFDDIYVCDGTGSSPTNTYLGDVRVEALFPNGNGNSSQLVGSDTNSTDNYLLVDETTPNVADFVESSTVGDKDTYTYTNPTPTTGTVYGVQVLPYAAKTDAGVRSIVSVARLSGTEVDSAAKTLSATPTYLPDIRETKPGGGAWSISDVSSAEFGVKINA